MTRGMRLLPIEAIVDGVSNREEAWSELLDAKPLGWFVGQPSYHTERGEWVLYACDPSERAKAGVRKREWQAVAPTEVEVVREMTRYLREVRERALAEIARQSVDNRLDIPGARAHLPIGDGRL